jgi:hypothetical protein
MYFRWNPLRSFRASSKVEFLFHRYEQKINFTRKLLMWAYTPVPDLIEFRYRIFRDIARALKDELINTAYILCVHFVHLVQWPHKQLIYKLLLLQFVMCNVLRINIQNKKQWSRSVKLSASQQNAHFVQKKKDYHTFHSPVIICNWKF